MLRVGMIERQHVTDEQRLFILTTSIASAAVATCVDVQPCHTIDVTSETQQGPLVAIGTAAGHVQLWNTSHCRMHRQLNVGDDLDVTPVFLWPVVSLPLPQTQSPPLFFAPGPLVSSPVMPCLAVLF